ncbi:preprotein translocase, YajC subunit [Dethiosulfatibacter aminovorans DSM 17477]|uniref:Preprotein translocase, YajC subunit n=1 Tax=Dethiosulfatibacter aminovorans DSM 17477 TaxID=1121476 RepID=A0A1M6D358_9FIRM|nr:preprotein translocase, YajC subunit [Dethiosulfatibacter aminovorans DSM 17477]
MAQGGATSIIFMVAMFAIFYFMLIRPQRKRDKQVKDMRASLKKR